MTNRALKIGQLIANAYPADTRLLFQKYGITVQPTGKTILDAYLVHGKPFAAELYQIARKSVSAYSNADGDLIDGGIYDPDFADNAAKTTISKKTTWDQFMNIFTKGGQVLTTTAGAWEQLSNIFSGGKSVSTGDATLSAEMLRLQMEAQANANSNQTKTYLLIGAGLLVVVLGFIMYQKR